jgi:hypothetical protein
LRTLLTGPALRPYAPVLFRGSGEAPARPGANIAFAPPYPRQHREQDQISEAAAIRKNPRVWWPGEPLALAQLDGGFDSAASKLLEDFSLGQFASGQFASNEVAGSIRARSAASCWRAPFLAKVF